MDQFTQPPQNNENNQGGSPEIPQNNQPMNEPFNPQGQPDSPEKGGMGALIGSIVVIIVLVFGAIYFWGRELNNAGVDESNGESLDQIEEDLNQDDLDNLDAEFDQTLEAELGQ